MGSIGYTINKWDEKKKKVANFQSSVHTAEAEILLIYLLLMLVDHYHILCTSYSATLVEQKIAH